MTTIAHTHRPEPHLERGPYGYVAPVAVPPYTEPNPAAHGNIEIIQVCGCGYERSVLINWPYHEYSPWRKGAALLAREREQEQLQNHWRVLAQLERAPIVLRTHGARILLSRQAAPHEKPVGADEVIIQIADSPRRRVTMEQLRQAALDWRGEPDTPAGAIYALLAKTLHLQPKQTP